MQSEAGHHASRCYIDQDGDFHLNGANFYTDESGTLLAGTEIAVLDGVTAGTITASKAIIADSNGAVADADLILESTNEINITIGGVTMLAIDDAAISSNAGASATAGKACYIETQDGGAGTGAGTAGGLFSVKAGDAGAAAAGVGNAGANGGGVTITAGAGSAVGTQASGTANGGSGGAVTIATGAGAGGGDSSGTDGSGGVLTLQTGAKGTGGSAAGIDGTIDFSLGGVKTAVFANAAITDFAAASATAGASLFVEIQKGGAGTTVGTAGGSLTATAGAAGAAAAGVGNAGGNGGAIALTAGAASAVGTQASGTANGGAGGSITLTAGAGGGGGDSSGTDGNGGDIVLSPGAAGTGGNTAGRAGVVSIADGKIGYIGAITMPGTTEGTNWLGIDVGTAPTGTIATSIAVYTNDGDNLSFLHADGTTDDLGT